MTGWAEKKFDNYFVGYHEPEYYHVEISGAITKPRSSSRTKGRLAISRSSWMFPRLRPKPPRKAIFAMVWRSAAPGTSTMPSRFLRAAKKWYVLKSSPSGLTVLTEGTAENVHDADVDDNLRVDAQGPNFLLHINDQLVGQVTDPDYASGEIGFYVEVLRQSQHAYPFQHTYDSKRRINVVL